MVTSNVTLNRVYQKYDVIYRQKYELLPLTESVWCTILFLLAVLVFLLIYLAFDCNFLVIFAVEYMNSCPELPVPAHANASFYDNGKGQVVMYKCIEGYTMIGFEKIYCVRYGYMAQWNGPPPVCVRKFVFTARLDVCYPIL